MANNQSSASERDLFANPASPEAPTAAEREKQGQQIVEKSIGDITDIQTKVTESLHLTPNSTEAVVATDQALGYIAESYLASSDATPGQTADALDDVGIESALETEHGLAAAQTPAAILELDGYGGDIDSVVARLHETHATLPSGSEASLLLMQAVDELNQHPVMQESPGEIEYVEGSTQNEALVIREYAQHWKLGEDQELEIDFMGEVLLRHSADELLQSRAFVDDSEIAAVVEARISELKEAEAASIAKTQREIDNLRELQGHSDDEASARIEVIIQGLSSRQDASPDEKWLRDPTLASRVGEVLASREQEILEQALQKRMQDDMLPWTMPNSEVPADTMSWFKSAYENIMHSEREPAPNDVYTIPRPMSGVRAPEDIALLNEVGIDFQKQSKITRADLQRAGVFFVNRIGDGEEPILGAVIPDAESDDGVMDLGKRCVFTKAEFEKIYRYQQEHDYGIGNSNPEDVQMDMIAFSMRSELNTRGVKKLVTPGDRITKYNQVYSPFVDLGYEVRAGGLEGDVVDQSGTKWEEGRNGLRMNSITVFLVNAHPDYPGLSEMSTPTAAHDQKYMSSGEFMKIYEPPTTRKEAFNSLLYGYTRREKNWVGPLGGVK